MRTLTHKRVLSAVLATGLAASAMVALAATSDAATVKLKADATTSAGAILTITGTDLLDDNGVAQYDVSGIRYTSAACTTTGTTPAAAATNTGFASSAAIAATAVSDTKLTVSTAGFTPTLVAGKAKYNICVYDTTGALYGSTTTTFYAPPATITAGVATLPGTSVGNIYVGSTAADSTGSNLTGPSLGGTKITVKGVDFTAKTYVTVGGVKLDSAKTTLAKVSSDADVITGSVPAGTGTKAIKIVGEFGTYPVGITGVTYATVSAGAVSWVYSPAITVSPSGSNGAAGNVITVKGVGFNARTFASAPADSSSAVVLVKAGTTINTALFYASSAYIAAGTTFQACASPTVVSDTELNCTIPALTTTKAGAYTVVIATMDASHALVAANTTGYSRGATYTSALF